MRNWKFSEIAPRIWVWDRANPDGTSTRVGPHASLAECIEEAKRAGFDESKLERRKRPRELK
ncbi:MAG: hypothetical protein ABI619_14105 [Betaproteobacteria bacterium]